MNKTKSHKLLYSIILTVLFIKIASIAAIPFTDPLIFKNAILSINLTGLVVSF